MLAHETNITNSVSPISRGLTSLQNTGTTLVGDTANLMPSDRQTNTGIHRLGNTSPNYLNERRYPVTTISHPKGAYSNVSSESFLLARSISTPGYQQNMVQTRYARTSDWVSHEPRFNNQVSILA
tara:strand:+ start:1646 stop:2020 length:375 start_codon:yes stop_codon:yes gene_type:complete